MGQIFGATTQTKECWLISSCALKKQGTGLQHQLHPVRPSTGTSAQLPAPSLPQPIPTSHRVHSGLQATPAAMVKFLEFPLLYQMEPDTKCQNDSSLVNPLSCWQSGGYLEETAWIDDLLAQLCPCPTGCPVSSQGAEHSIGHISLAWCCWMRTLSGCSTHS